MGVYQLKTTQTARDDRCLNPKTLDSKRGSGFPLDSEEAFPWGLIQQLSPWSRERAGPAPFARCPSRLSSFTRGLFSVSTGISIWGGCCALCFCEVRLTLNVKNAASRSRPLIQYWPLISTSKLLRMVEHFLMLF